jgi:hypothetical protein
MSTQAERADRDAHASVVHLAVRARRCEQLLPGPGGHGTQGPLQEPVRNGRGGQSVRAGPVEPQHHPYSHRRRAPHGRGEGAKRQPLCNQDGRAGTRGAVDRPSVLGRARRPPAQPGPARPLCRSLQRRRRLPGHAALRGPRAHRRKGRTRLKAHRGAHGFHGACPAQELLEEHVHLSDVARMGHEQ